MKRNLLTAVTVMLLVLSVAFCAHAAEIRPLESGHDEIDLANGVFRLRIMDADKISDSGYFTASLYLEDHYDASQIESLAPGDTVLVNGKAWTVREVEPHSAEEPGLVESYEIFTEEENDGYIVFLPSGDGCYVCITDDWTPVTPVGDVRVMLPLPDKFEFYYGEDETPGGMDAFVDHLELYGNSFTAYNTTCAFEDGMLIRISHSDYPVGPQAEDEETDQEADEAAAEDNAAVPVWKFCHGLRDGLETAEIKGYESSCEEGPIEYEMTAEEITEIRNIALNGVITGKANDMSVTGGTWIYTFTDPEGKMILAIELYKGLIVSSDGMYSYALK